MNDRYQPLSARPTASGQSFDLGYTRFIGIGDADSLHLSGTVDAGKHPDWPYQTINLHDLEFINGHRTLQGANAGLHVDLCQILGCQAEQNITLSNIAFRKRPLPALPAGATFADTCLIQEGQFNEILYRGVLLDGVPQPCKLTLRRIWCYARTIIIRDSVNFRLDITVVDPNQIGKVIIASSPSCVVTANKAIFNDKGQQVGSQRIDISAKVRTGVICPHCGWVF